ncbi:ComEC/Rec2 family competence protein [Christensenellaceae bacterium OttesenSCG-928-K19]|nr:ComEC/Rec2 family competence protein [Christensenellaceae bacterium OttesenSCG-928-K19]
MRGILNERPVAFATFFFVAGIALAYYLELPFEGMLFVMTICTCLFFVLLCVGQKIVLPLLYAAVFCVGAVLFCAQYNVDYSGIDTSVEYRIEGRVTDVQQGEYNCYTISDVRLADDERQTKIKFDKRAFLYSQEPLEYGDRIRFHSKINIPSEARNPGALDERMYLASKGVGLSFFGYEVELLGNDPGMYGALLSLRESLSGQFDRYFTEETAPLAKAMFLGVKGEMPDEVRDEFSQTGISHVLAISGLHITIIAGVLLFLLKKLKVARNLRFILVLALLAFYALLTGLAPSVVRAVIMTAMMLVGRWRFKGRDTLTFLCIALLMTLSIFGTPLLFMPGLLLSYSVVFALLCLMPAINRWLDKIKFSNTFSSLFFVSCVASAAVMPLTAYYFGSISIIAPLANFYAIPLASVAVVMCLFFSVFSFFPPFAAILAVVPQLALTLLLQANTILAQEQIGYITVEGFPVWGGLLAFGLIFICSDYLLIRKKWKAVLVAVVAGILILGAGLSVAVNKNVLEITMLDVGTGDAIHIRTQEGDYLIDNGGNLQRSQVEAYTENNHLSYDMAIITNDRTNNLGTLVKSGQVDLLKVPRNYIPKKWDGEIRIQTYGLYDRIDLGGGVALEFLCTDGKNYSVVVSLDGRPVCLLAQTKADVLEESALPVVDMLKIAKGGTADSVTQRVLDRTNPDVVAVSVKKENAKGLPEPQVLRLIAANEIEVCQTAQSGALIFMWDTDNEMTVRMMK